MLPESTQFAAALQIVKTLRARGYEAWLAGGCVRDLLLGREPEDYDVATSATPDVVLRMFPARSQWARTSAWCWWPRKRQWIAKDGEVAERCVTEVATFRSDGVYSDGRHPDEVRYTNIGERRRTAARLHHQRPAPRPTRLSMTGEELPSSAEVANAVMDYVGGLDDLDAGVIRAIGEPHRRFEEDQLRLLRAVRFAARFGFELEAQRPPQFARSPRAFTR